MRRSSRKGDSLYKPRALTREVLHKQWPRLHAGDREPFPDAAGLRRLEKKHAALGAWLDAEGGAGPVAEALQEAWCEFHGGDFARAVRSGERLGALGATVANKAAAIESINAGRDQARGGQLLEAAVQRGEAAVSALPGYPNAHYTLALALGRYSQRISILTALAEGLATRVRAHLERTLELEPRHAEAHIALGLYHAEIVGKLGALMARLTYQVSADAALKHFRRALELAPESPIAHIEYAQGLLLLDARGNAAAARKLYAQAAGIDPADAMERLDVGRAREHLVEE